MGGSKLHLKVLETIYHPGHYRVALALNSRDELPAVVRPSMLTRRALLHTTAAAGRRIP